MISRFLGKMFSGRLFGPLRPKIVPHGAHRIAREGISSCALRTTQTLQRHGYAAFIVGGAVRDLLLGRKPKDFDIATAATPEQVRELFRRSRVIGRRFRLVHVLCGPEMVEVSTFRGTNGTAEESDQQVADEHGRILRDNVFGTQEQDATRRDFTLNALFYDPATQEVWDYHGGVADLGKRRLRLIGDPEQRYREDPIRMLRAVRFAASRGLEIDAPTRRPIRRLAGLLAHVPPSRLLDEMLKLLLCGHAAGAVIQLRREGLHHGVLPLLDAAMGRAAGERFVVAALASTDARIGDGKSVSPGFLFAALLWPEVLAEWKVLEGKSMPPVPALYQAMDHVMKAQAGKLPIPHRHGADMREIWAMQPRFPQRSGKRPYRLLEHPRFRAAYDFLRLRCESGETDAELGEWWERFQHAGEAERERLLVADSAPAQASRKRRRTRPCRRRQSHRLKAEALPPITHHSSLITAFVALGSNLGDPASQIRRAMRALAALRGTRLARQSSLYRNPPAGGLDQPEFVNAVAQIETALAARDLLELLLEIERMHGRARDYANAPRTLDLDIVLYGEQVVREPGLAIPHPRMLDRPFVLVPLAEIAPDAVVPGHGRVADLADKLDASSLVKLEIQETADKHG